MNVEYKYKEITNIFPFSIALKQIETGVDFLLQIRC